MTINPPDPVEPNRGAQPYKTPASRAFWLAVDLVLAAALFGGVVYWLVHR